MAKRTSAFGRYLRGKRTQAGLSASEVARQIGVSQEFLSRTERGERPPLKRKYWPELIRAVPGLTHADLEKYAAADRPLALDLASAPAEYSELGLALARRIADRDLPSTDLAALLEILDTSSGKAKRAHGRVLGRDGRPVSGTAHVYRLSRAGGWRGLIGDRDHAARSAGPLIARGARDLGKPIDLLGPNDPRGEGFFDVPGGLSLGEYALDVHHDGGQEWAWPLNVTDGKEPQDVWLGGPERSGEPVPTPAPAPRPGPAPTPGPGPAPAPTPSPKPPPPSNLPPVPKLDQQFRPGTFTLAASMYGLLGAPFDRIQRTLELFRSRGFGNGRVWIEWEKPDDRCRVFNRDGSVRTPQMALLVKALDYAGALGMTLDLTMSSARYDSTKVGGGSGEAHYDISAHKRAAQELVRSVGGHAALAFVDLGNECNQRGAGGSGDPKSGHLSPGAIHDLVKLCRSASPGRRVRLSASMEGDSAQQIDAYKKVLKRGSDLIDIYLPHLTPRKPGWGAKEGAEARAIAKGLSAKLPIYLQEPACRRTDLGTELYPANEFEAAFRGAYAARGEGVVGICFHQRSCFFLANGEAYDALDPVEREVFEHAAEWVR